MATMSAEPVPCPPEIREEVQRLRREFGVDPPYRLARSSLESYLQTDVCQRVLAGDDGARISLHCAFDLIESDLLSTEQRNTLLDYVSGGGARNIRPARADLTPAPLTPAEWGYARERGLISFLPPVLRRVRQRPRARAARATRTGPTTTIRRRR
jgi:hypothetical protein